MEILPTQYELSSVLSDLVNMVRERTASRDIWKGSRALWDVGRAKAREKTLGGSDPIYICFRTTPYSSSRRKKEQLVVRPWRNFTISSSSRLTSQA